MSGYARFNRNFLLCVAGYFAFVGAMNYVIDPHGVFGSGVFPYDVDLNQRFAKIAFLQRNKAQFNGFIMGASRAALIDPRRLEPYLPGSKFYNLAVALGGPQDHLQHLEYFLANGYDVRTLYVQIDLDLLSMRIRRRPYGMIPHPAVVGDSTVLRYLEYLTILPIETMKLKLQWNMNPSLRTIDVDIVHTGMLSFPHRDARIRKEPLRYIAEEPSFHERTKRTGYADLTPSLASLEKFKRQCDAHNVHCILFTTPLHHRMMDTVNPRGYAEFLHGLARISDYYDFMGYNTVTLDDHNYYESSHYRPHVADFIAARIFEDSAANVPRDFGALITPDNVDAHVRAALEEIERRDREKEKGRS